MTMTDTELESRVTATLRAKGAQVPATVREFEPDLVALTPLAARGRRRTPVLVAAVAALVVAIAIGVALVLVDRDESSKPAGEPPSPPVSQIQIVALPTLSYQAREFTTEPGLNEIEFYSAGGTHTLTFADPEFADVKLESWDNRTERATVRLEAGRDYVVHDVIPVHQQAGETAVIHVTNGPAGPTKGAVSDVLRAEVASPAASDGQIFGPDPQAMQPDYVQIDTHRGQPVYVKRLDFLPPGGSGLVPAYADDLSTVVGLRDPLRGFVPLGEDPESAPGVVVTTTPPPPSSP